MLVTLMNPLGELLTPNDVSLDLDVANKYQLLDRVAAMLAARHGLSKTLVTESLTLRKQLGSTGVGHGTAIPHARTLDAPAVLSATSQ